MRVTRHNRVANRLAGALKQKGYVVHSEEHIRTSEGLRKPDLICVRKGKAIVIDVQVGGGMEPDKAYDSKVNYYCVLPEISDRAKEKGCCRQ